MASEISWLDIDAASAAYGRLLREVGVGVVVVVVANVATSIAVGVLLARVLDRSAVVFNVVNGVVVVVFVTGVASSGVVGVLLISVRLGIAVVFNVQNAVAVAVGLVAGWRFGLRRHRHKGVWRRAGSGLAEALIEIVIVIA